MKFTTTVNGFKKLCWLPALVVEKKSTIPILETVMLDTGDATLTGTNPDNTVRVSLGIKPSKKGERVCIPLQPVRKWLAVIKEDGPLLIETNKAIPPRVLLTVPLII